MACSPSSSRCWFWIFGVTAAIFSSLDRETRLAAGIPVSVYAAVFFLVNLTYSALCAELVDRPDASTLPPRMRRRMRLRAIVTLIVFGSAAIVALWYPLVGFGLACCCLVMYLRPQAPGH